MGGVICINGGVIFIVVSCRCATLREIHRDILYLLDARCMIYHEDAEISSFYNRKRYREIRKFSDCYCFSIHSEGKSYHRLYD